MATHGDAWRQDQVDAALAKIVANLPNSPKNYSKMPAKPPFHPKTSDLVQKRPIILLFIEMVKN
eukprot:4548203-Amphidinium_carterae.1